MAEHPNVGIIRDGYDLFNKGEIPAAMELWADDIVWHAVGNNPLTGIYRGKQEVAGFFAKMQELGAAGMNIDVHDILANDDHAIVLVNAHVERGDRHLDVRAVHVWHLRDGKATEYWGIPEDQAAADAFWS